MNADEAKIHDLLMIARTGRSQRDAAADRWERFAADVAEIQARSTQVEYTSAPSIMREGKMK